MTRRGRWRRQPGHCEELLRRSNPGPGRKTGMFPPSLYELRRRAVAASAPHHDEVGSAIKTSTIRCRFGPRTAIAPTPNAKPATHSCGRVSGEAIQFDQNTISDWTSQSGMKLVLHRAGVRGMRSRRSHCHRNYRVSLTGCSPQSARAASIICPRGPPVWPRACPALEVARIRASYFRCLQTRPLCLVVSQLFPQAVQIR
jgi:hypothetical protein